MPAATGRLALYIKLLPVVLGALPIVAAIAGQFASRPDDPRLTSEKMNSIREVGSIFRIQDMALASERSTLIYLALGLIVLLVAFLVFVWPVGSTRALVKSSMWANEKYFSRFRFLATTVFLIGALTASFILVPDAIAQFVGSFGVIALFAACVTGIVVHLGLLTIKHDIPFLPLIFGILFVATFIIAGDNHELRTVSQDKASQPSPRVAAVTAFQDWLKQPYRVAEAEKLRGVSSLHCRGAGRRHLCRPQCRAVPGAYAGPLSGISATSVRDQRGLRG